MRTWLVRGFWLGLLHGAVQTGTAAVGVHSPEAASSTRYIAFGLVVVIGVLWGALDAWRGLDGPGMVWFRAALVAGPLAGVVGVVGRSLVDQTGIEALGSALTGGAAFTALLVMVSAAIGTGIGAALPQPDESRQSDAPRPRAPRPGAPQSGTR
ncbi:B-4DMT family transporter [Actinosynnema sp. NPDC023658]|uniref:B-4DMT family transporter n=1 Tax=Actinosynnema sp. NPDC023658 TaxID=3155465 RepID=UPI0033DEFD1D